jgi:probable blue pigment (indigoidine) exporter
MVLPRLLYIKYLNVKILGGAMINGLLAAVAPLFWGTTYIVTTSFLPPGRPLLAAAFRALPIGLLFVLIGREVPRGSWVGKSFVLGFFNIGLFFALLFVAAYRLPGGVAATVGGVGPLVAAVLAWVILGTKPSAATLAAGAGGMLGVALLVLRPKAVLDPVGVAAALGATGSSALGAVLSRRWGRPVSLVAYTGWQLAAGGLILVILCAGLEGPPPRLSPTNIGGFAYLGLIGTGLAYALWFRGIETIGVSIFFFALLSPVTASVLGYVVLDQTFTAIQGIGMALILASVAVGQWEGAR